MKRVEISIYYGRSAIVVIARCSYSGEPQCVSLSFGCDPRFDNVEIGCVRNCEVVLFRNKRLTGVFWVSVIMNGCGKMIGYTNEKLEDLLKDNVVAIRKGNILMQSATMARKLEAQLDEQMNSYRKLVSTKVSTKVEAAENDLEIAIDRLVKQLQQLNSQMQDWVSSGGSEMVSHTLTRHQEILQDLNQEFHRLRSSLRAKHEHASLLEDFREFDRTRSDLEEGVGSPEQALMKEHVSINRSTGHMDSVISQAQSTLGALVFQRSTFGGINSKLGNVSSRLPTINHVLSSIKRRKSMDTIILSLVASMCTFVIFIYWLTK